MTMLETRGPKPYGDVTYADPKNGKYPIDTEEHVRAAWSYINMPKNAAHYPLNGVTLESVKARIRAAMKRIGAHTDDDSSHAQGRQAFELRKRRRGSMGLGQAERRGMLLEVRAKPDGTGGTTFEFEGYGSVFSTPFQMWDKWGDPYTEIVKPGAFTRSLQRPDLDVPFLIGHDESRIALARTKNGTMQLSEDSHGLLVRAQLDGRRSDVRDLAYAVERGDMDEMSVGFITRQHQWSEDYETRSMIEMDVHRGDVSPVALAAIPETAGSRVTFPTETHSRSQRAASNPDDPDNDHMQPMVGANHGEFTGEHAHPHDAFGRPEADGDGQHPHSHFHNADNEHNHVHDIVANPVVTQDVGPGSMAAGRPLERRGNPVDQGLGDAADYNADGQQMGCNRATCPQQGVPAAGRYCSWCGDALVRIDDQGVPGMEEEQGESAVLAQKRRELELRRLRHRGELLVVAGRE